MLAKIAGISLLNIDGLQSKIFFCHSCLLIHMKVFIRIIFDTVIRATLTTTKKLLFVEFIFVTVIKATLTTTTKLLFVEFIFVTGE